MTDTWLGFVDYIRNEFPDKVIFADSANKNSAGITGKQYALRIVHLRHLLLKRIRVRGAKVVSLLESGTFWNIIDLASMSAGAVHVALSPTLEEEDILKFINYLQPEIVIYNNPQFEKRLIRVLQGIQFPIQLIYSEEINEDFAAKGERFENEADTGIKPDSIASIFFTSGTSGSAKGIVHTHGKMLENVIQTVDFYRFDRNLKTLSFLPLHYAYERMYNYVFQYGGLEVNYANPAKSLYENIVAVQPNVLTIVPVFLIELNNLLLSTKGVLFNSLICWIRDIQPVFICSGAPLSQQVCESLTGFGCKVYDMYGSTETLIVSANSGNYFKAGSVGKLIEEGRILIGEDGEVLVKNIMQGYFYPKEETLGSLYYSSGDLGALEDGFLKILGRKKTLFKNEHGVYVNPAEYEDLISREAPVRNIVVTEHNGGITAIIEPTDFGADTIGLVEEAVFNFNRKQPVQKLIKFIAVSGFAWTTENGFLTLSSKPVRDDVYHYFKEKLRELSES